MRIVSLVPSLSELVSAIGLESSLVGCTNFCVHPKSLRRRVTSVGGTKDAELAKIAALKPSHILVNREENPAELIAACRALAPTLETAPTAPADVPPMIEEISRFLELSAGATHENAHQAACELAASVRAELATWPTHAADSLKPCLYFIWRNPWMLAGRPTYIDGMLSLLGLRNLAPTTSRYPTLSEAELPAAGAELLLFSSEPWPFRRRDREALEAFWPNPPPCLWIDGQLMSWYGSSTLTALRAMRAYLRAEASPLLRPLA